MTIETMTPEEATEFLRNCGMKISVETMRNGLKSEKYPFGLCIEGGKQPVYQIFVRQLHTWAKERATGEEQS